MPRKRADRPEPQKPTQPAAVQETSDNSQDLPPEIRALARKHSAAAIAVLAKIVNGELEATPAAKVSAANSLLEYAYGKPAQQSNSTVQSGPSAADLIRDHAQAVFEMAALMPKI